MTRKANETLTPGATRASAGNNVFNMTKVNHLLGGPDYSSANGAVVEGDKIIVGLMRMAKGTGAEPHHHPNEQWIYLLEGAATFTIDGKANPAKAGDVVYIPSNAVHAAKVTSDQDAVFFTCKDATHSLQGIKVK